MNIYISGLSYGINNADLTNLFAEFGEVSSAKVIFDRETGRSRGFAFVEMPNDDEARSAIAGLNETELDGRTIVVKEAEPKENRPKKNFNRPSFGGGGGDRGGNRSSSYDRDRKPRNFDKRW